MMGLDDLKFPFIVLWTGMKWEYHVEKIQDLSLQYYSAGHIEDKLKIIDNMLPLMSKALALGRQYMNLFDSHPDQEFSHPDIRKHSYSSRDERSCFDEFLRHLELDYRHYECMSNMVLIR